MPSLAKSVIYNNFQHLAECLTQNIDYILSYPTSKMESIILYKDENKNLYMRYYLTSDSFCMSTNIIMSIDIIFKHMKLIFYN